MSRPFAIGDLVTLPEIGNNHIGFVWFVTINSVIIMFDKHTGRKATFDLNGFHKDEDYQHYPAIKTIRTQRKGCKEARDIVARCLLKVRWLRNTKKFTLKSESIGRHETIQSALIFGHEIYRYQKSILGGHNA